MRIFSKIYDISISAVELRHYYSTYINYLVKQKEGHYFRNEENRLDFYRHLEVFLAKHLQN